MPHARVLIVDDDLALLEALPETVRTRMPQVEVQVSESARAALGQIRAVDYDAIVSDIKMPDMDGLDLLAEVSVIRPDTPMLLITGHGEHDLAVRALRGGAYDFIQKPIDRDYFMASLDRAIQTRQLRRQVEHHKVVLAQHASELERTVQERTRELIEANREKDTFLRARDQALAEAHAAQRRLAFLADASRVLAGSLDYAATLDQVARFTVPTLADFCVVTLLDHHGGFRRMALAHRDVDKQDVLHQLYEHLANLPASGAHPLLTVLQTHQSRLYADLQHTEPSSPIEMEYLEVHRALDARSVMIVPLIARGRTLGVISLGRIGARGPYTDADVALAEDLARRAALAMDNARLYSEGQEANRIKDEFLATISHELRTPLTAILGWAQMLRSGQLDEATASKALGSIERNAQTQAHLIEDLLDISRIITGKLRLDARPLELGPIIDAALDAVRPAADAKGIRLQKRLDPRAGYVSGDPTRLQQVVWNLLSNGIKFTPRGGRVEVHMERVDSHVQLTVKDTGQGIPRHFLPYIFDIFRQADSTITRKHAGLGLGLAIVRHVVEMHGGTVYADSPGEGQGAVFSVRLPLAGIPQAGSFLDGDDPKQDGRPLRLDHAPALDGLRVLVVEDEPETREMLTAVLQGCGAEVRACASSNEALEVLQRGQVDVLVSDIGMPGHDGYELIRKVRAMEQERGGRIPAVALTAYARVEDRLRALSVGYQIHVPKPVEPVELAAVVASVAGRNAVPPSSLREHEKEVV